MNVPESTHRPRERTLAQILTKYLPFITIGIAAIMLLAINFGWLDIFCQGLDAQNMRGYSYFSVPRSYLNLLAHYSPYNTWILPGYDSHSGYSIYLAHPAFSVFVASWFSFFEPWTGFWVFAFFSIGVMAYCGYSISKTTNDPLKKRLCYFFLVCSFPTFWILYAGNIHAVFVLGITLIFVGIYDITYGDNISNANSKLLTGLLIALFTKPIAVLMLPLLILTKETRVTALKSLAIYIVVSVAFLAIPLFNPEGVGFTKLAHIAFDFDFIKQNMNIFNNHFVLNEYMKDNSFHWLNLIAQSDARQMFGNNFSFPVFLDTIVGFRLPSFIYQFPILVSLILSTIIPFVMEKRIRLEATMLLLLSISLLYFISYSTAWEHQFASVLPIVALLPILAERDVFYKRYIPLMFCLGAIESLPSLAFLIRGISLSDDSSFTLIRLDKIVPVYLLFWTITIIMLNFLRAQFKIRRQKLETVHSTSQSPQIIPAA